MRKNLITALIMLCAAGNLFSQDSTGTTVVIPKGSIVNLMVKNDYDTVKPPAKPVQTVFTTLSFERYYLPYSDNSWCTSIVRYFKGSTDYIYPDDYVVIKSDVNLDTKSTDSLRLWIDHVCFSKLKPMFVNEKDSTFIFQLTYDTASTSPWKLFYAWPGYTTIHHPISMSLGTEKTEFKLVNKPVSKGNIRPVELRTSVPWMMIAGYLLFIALTIVAVRLKLGLLKSPADFIKKGVQISFDKKVKTDAATGVINVRDLQFSLARTQFLFWLAIIFFSIIHIWAITDTLAIPNGSVLLLIGVSSGTFYISRLIDSSQVKQNDDAAPQPTPQEVVEKFLKDKQQSHGFLMDVLNDGSAISLHRLQLVVFTAFLGLFFLWQVICSLNLPQIDNTMLLLMGISSGTYAGMKTSE